VPNSLLEASADMRAARSRRASRAAAAILPGLAAGSIFTFSLTSATSSPRRSSAGCRLGLHRQRRLPQRRVANDVPFAAASRSCPSRHGHLPLLARRLGAFEAL